MTCCKTKLVMKKPKMNKLEAAFAEHLEAQLKSGKIQWYGFEPIRLRIGLGALYTPDFGVLHADGAFTFYETKGSFFREAAKVRLKVAREKFPFFEFVVARKESCGWVLGQL